ncbi:serine/threonine-protein kinase phg2 [Polistes fuscatus]|uniref:serine/threonine-protein kinase phg2 n=1 Tax=Polistes fuscatus TaxID=30207 RepID=UPI001CA7DC13|nr:serine/threonine-protein kinase phg2 [Polistes fuscatus]XP_043498661.1 serine/threonine-protein kinase phg2 [Polistes fuscatus]
MAGALSENAPRPVSVVGVDGSTVVIVRSNTDDQEPRGDNNNNNNRQSNNNNNNGNNNNPSNNPNNTSSNNNGNSSSSSNFINGNGNGNSNNSNNVRSFTSTEAQTEVALQNGPEVLEEFASESRGARRRERRMRRQHRRALRSCSLPPTYPGAANAAVAVGACPASATAPGVPLVPPTRGFLHPPPPHLGLRGLSLGLPFPVPTSVSAFGRDAVPKQCCGLGSPPVRWSILGVGVVGLVCAGAGALLGALRASGRDHIAVALLMIGIGVVLVSVSAVAWRVTSRENCGSFFGFTGITGRIPPARPIHPYAAMIYPEFQFRTPPPSYQASMQEYRLRLLLLDRLQPTSSPPPTYRSNASSIVAAGGGGGGTVRESRPPSYCTRGNPTPNVNLVPSKKDANLVRIVQTEADPVILSGDQTPPVPAVEVLAHL